MENLKNSDPKKPRKKTAFEKLASQTVLNTDSAFMKLGNPFNLSNSAFDKLANPFNLSNSAFDKLANPLNLSNSAFDSLERIQNAFRQNSISERLEEMIENFENEPITRKELEEFKNVQEEKEVSISNDLEAFKKKLELITQQLEQIKQSQSPPSVSEKISRKELTPIAQQLQILKELGVFDLPNFQKMGATDRDWILGKLLNRNDRSVGTVLNEWITNPTKRTENIGILSELLRNKAKR
jgi:hypothetical protein